MLAYGEFVVFAWFVSTVVVSCVVLLWVAVCVCVCDRLRVFCLLCMTLLCSC